jgi:hypothetical protein
MKIKIGDLMRYRNVKRGIDAICLIVRQTSNSDFDHYYDVEWISGVKENQYTESIYIDFTSQFGKWEKLS